MKIKYKVRKGYLDTRNSIAPKYREKGNIIEYDKTAKLPKGLLKLGYIEKITTPKPQIAEPGFPNLAEWRNNGIFSKTTDLIIAPEDYYEITNNGTTGKTKQYFTWDEAIAAQKKMKGWRLPTRHEWVMICEEFGLDAGGGEDSAKLRAKLDLVLNGCYASGVYGQSDYGYWWSSTENSSSNAYYLHLASDSAYTYPASVKGKYCEVSVRYVQEANTLKEVR